ncbi:hypothetical protein GCM10008995_02010 [Halobellus salinus]|uniref:DUF8168 domain-containing protein n=1 Tax=Halobellus salinus TaxID=931585 RepID=A0A830ENY0_9EURY|nr:hypothetical protein [Halobellus salinus]GGI95498.1 hypothetical protein GCM10008995_02010 [Halobellus salinus]SMP12394.1 hypothetical protein SAMN06265347_10447 [Halobellus salinus]
MSDAQTPDATPEAETDAPPMVAVYRHDTHKLRGRAHEHAAEEVAGVRVNEPVPLGADRDAALLSRPRGEPEQTVDAHASPRRLSLLTGDPQRDPTRTDADAALQELVTPTDPEQLHERWLSSEFAARFNESVYYPYTSLKYHTLLAAALLDNYRAGFAFDELYVEATPDRAVTPHRTVLATPQCSLRITGDPSGPAARLGSEPARSFGAVWAQLPECPFDTGTREWRVVDAQLRRITAWSTGLQYIEEYTAAYTPTTDASTATQGDDDVDEEVDGGGSPGWEVTNGWAATRPVSFRVGVGVSGGPGPQIGAAGASPATLDGAGRCATTHRLVGQRPSSRLSPGWVRGSARHGD